mgnify:CR=1 FL=1
MGRWPDDTTQFFRTNSGDRITAVGVAKMLEAPDAVVDIEDQEDPPPAAANQSPPQLVGGTRSEDQEPENGTEQACRWR